MTTSKKVLITPSVLFAFIDRNDPRHAQADAFFRFFAQENFRVFVHQQSIVRTYTDLRKFMSISVAKDFLRAIYVGNIEILYSDDSAARAAIKLILGETQHNLDFEQVLINVLADRHQIPQICSFEYSNFYFGIKPFALPF